MEVSDEVRWALPILENAASGGAWRFTPYSDIRPGFPISFRDGPDETANRRLYILGV